MKQPNTCDHCENNICGPKPEITLKGYKRTSDGGILLPERYHEQHFCDRACFVEWMRLAMGERR